MLVTSTVLEWSGTLNFGVAKVLLWCGFYKLPPEARLSLLLS